MIEELCAKIKAKRLEKKLSIQEVAEKTKLALQIISHIEELSLDQISPAYLKGFIKIYANFLGIELGEDFKNASWIKDKKIPAQPVAKVSFRPAAVEKGPTVDNKVNVPTVTKYSYQRNLNETSKVNVDNPPVVNKSTPITSTSANNLMTTTTIPKESKEVTSKPLEDNQVISDVSKKNNPSVLIYESEVKPKQFRPVKTEIDNKKVTGQRSLFTMADASRSQSSFNLLELLKKIKNIIPAGLIKGFIFSIITVIFVWFLVTAIHFVFKKFRSILTANKSAQTNIMQDNQLGIDRDKLAKQARKKKASLKDISASQVTTVKPSKDVVTETKNVPTVSKDLTVSLTVKRSCYVKAKVDGKVVFDGFLKQNTKEIWVGKKELEFKISDGSAISLEVNGKAYPMISAMRKSIKSLKITPKGITVDK